MARTLVLPLVIAHRGASLRAPENTLAAIRLAAEEGARWVEVDVKLTSDEVPVLLHDSTLDRTTNGHGRITETPWDRVEELDAGQWFDRSFIDEPLPTLEEALELILDLGLGVNLELKPCTGREAETAEVALDLASRIWPEESPPPLISSFSQESLERAADLLPDWPRGVLFDALPDDWQREAARVDAASIHLNQRRLDRQTLRTILDFGKPVVLYTVNNPDDARRWLDWGVASIITDDPAPMVRAVNG